MLDTWVSSTCWSMRGPKVPLGSKDARTVGCWENDGKICCSFWTLNTLRKSIHFDVAHASFSSSPETSYCHWFGEHGKFDLNTPLIHIFRSRSTCSTRMFASCSSALGSSGIGRSVQNLLNRRTLSSAQPRALSMNRFVNILHTHTNTHICVCIRIYIYKPKTYMNADVQLSMKTIENQLA